MGTNFYFYRGDTESAHIGKRSAAGLYCWDCRMSLCSESYDRIREEYRYGQEAVHYSSREDWLSTCPLCGKSKTQETLADSSVGRELGFNHTIPAAKTGISSCSSFSWAISPRGLRNRIEQGMEIRDEYGRSYTLSEFQAVLSECPIQSFKNVGADFC